MMILQCSNMMKCTGMLMKLQELIKKKIIENMEIKYLSELSLYCQLNFKNDFVHLYG